MNKHALSLDALIPCGHVETALRDGELTATTTRSLPTDRLNVALPFPSYLALPGRYRLPLRIDLTVKINAPGLYVLPGNGRVNFGTFGMDNRRLDDIVEPRQKTCAFDHRIPLNAFADIALVYDLHAMQILVDGEERYYSARERYMKSPSLAAMNGEGFPIRIASDKRVTMTLRAVAVTEYDTGAGIVHTADLPPVTMTNNGIPEGEKLTFDNCIARLPEALRREVIQTDAWLRGLLPLKCKRLMEAHGNKITYVAADYGFSYAIHVHDALLFHTLQWYILTAGKPETWGRKADWMERTLARLAEADPAFARRMFANLEDCVGCAPGCRARTVYAFEGKKTAACHGKMRFLMRPPDFADARRVIEAVNEQAKGGAGAP